MTIPEVINDMRCYIDGNDDCISASSVDLPDLSSMTTDVKGIGSRAPHGARGLKLQGELSRSQYIQSRPARARGLKLKN